MVLLDYLLTTRKKMSTTKWKCMCPDPDVCNAGYHLQNTCPKSGDSGDRLKQSDPLPKPKKAKPAKKAAAKKAPAKKAAAAPKAKKAKAASQMSLAEVYDEMAALERRRTKLETRAAALESESDEEE